MLAVTGSADCVPVHCLQPVAVVESECEVQLPVQAHGQCEAQSPVPAGGKSP